MASDLQWYGGGGMSPPPAERVVIDNRSDLPDEAVQYAVETWWVENAALQFGQPTTFQRYAVNEGSLLARSEFQTPRNVFEEIRLARDMADRDDDVGAFIGGVCAIAFGEGMENFHKDDTTVRLFNRACRHMNLDVKFQEFYRELLISSQVNSVGIYSRTRLDFLPDDTEDRVVTQLAVPMLGTIPAENIRIVGNDLVGTGELAFKVEQNPALETWLEEYFSQRTSAARKNTMRLEEPVTAALFTERVVVPWDGTDLLGSDQVVYKLNPRMVHRSHFPKGASPYPRPLLTRNFPLLEAKRLLNIMDYALLQGGTNYIVIAKKGTDERPAMQPEIDNLKEQVRTMGKSGVLVGDHRLNIEIVTPNLGELLNPAKRKLIGQKLAAALMRRPQTAVEDPGAEGSKSEAEWESRVIMSDRLLLKRHVERHVYEEIVKRNRSQFAKGAPKLWFPKVILSGLRDWLDYVLKLRDRGDIPRKWSVEAAGFDYEAGLAQREREMERGDDEILTPGEVPFNSPDGPPGDVPPGRPPGTSPGNGRNNPADPAPQRVPQPSTRQRRGEPIRAWWDEGQRRVLRMGELTGAILSEYPDAELGRTTEIERDAAVATEAFQRGPVLAVPLNCGYDVDELRAVRLEPGLSMLVGARKKDGAMVAKALCFRDSQYTEAQAEERAMRWGFEINPFPETGDEPQVTIPPPGNDPMLMLASAFVAAAGGGQLPPITLQLPGPDGRPVKKRIERDPESGEITAVIEEPVEPEPGGE